MSFSTSGGGSCDRRHRDPGGGGAGYERPRRTARAAGGVRGPLAGECCGGRGCAMDRDIEQPEEVAVLYLKVHDADTGSCYPEECSKWICNWCRLHRSLINEDILCKV